MAISIGVVEGTIRFRDEGTSQLNAFASQLEKHGKRMQVVGRQMSSVGSLLTAGVTLPMIAVGGAAIKMSMDLNEGMANVATLIPGNTERVAELRTEIQGLSVDVGKSTSDLTAGLYQTISAFGDTTETVEVLEINARAATAGLSTTLEAIDLTSAVTKAYGDTSAVAVQKVADLSLITVRLGQTTFPELAESIGRVTSLSQSMGQSQEDLFAVFATATGVTGNAARVSTQYMGVLNALMKPTADLSALIAEQGFASGEAMLRQLGLVDTLELIADTAISAGKPITEYIAQIEAVPLALALAGPQADVFRQKLEAMAGAAGATDAAFREQTEGVNAAGFAWKQTRAEVEVALQQLGQELLPVFTSFLKVLRPVIGGLEGVAKGLAAMPEPARAVAVAFFGITAAAGPALFITGQLIMSWGTLASTAPLLAARIALVGNALRTIATGPLGFVALGFIATGAVINEQLKRWAEDSARDIGAMVKDIDKLKGALDGLRAAARRGVTTDDEILAATRALQPLTKELAAIERTLKFSSDKREREGLLFRKGVIESEMQGLEGWLSVASKLPRINEEISVTAEQAAGPPGGVTQLSDALGDAVKSMAGTIAETAALLDAQIKSQAAYDTLNTLIEAGVPLEDALTGQYDRQAQVLLVLRKALADLEDNRSKAIDLAKDLAENEKALADAIALELTAWEDLAAGREAGDTPAAVVFDVDQIAVARAAVEELRAEEERRRSILQEINVLLAEGAITQREAAAAAAKLGVEYSKFGDALEAMMKRAWENIQDTAASAISGIFEKYIDTGNEAIDSLLKSFIRMLAELLVLWIANAAKRAAAERAVAASSSAAGAASGGGGGGWLSSLGSLFGGGGGGGSSAGWMAGGALGALAIVGVVGAFAYWAHSDAAKKAAKRWFGVAEVRDGWNAMFGSVEVLGLTEAIRDQVSEIFAAIGGQLSSLPSITVDAQASGEQFRSFVDGVLVGYFKTFEEAFQAAALQAVEQSDLSRMIPEIAAALSAGTIQSLDQLQDVAEVFATIRQALDPTGAAVDAFNAQIEEMGRILDAAGIARTVLAEFEAAGLQALRDQITGVTKSAQQLFNEQMESFNRRVEEQRALETAALAVAEAEQLAAEAEVARLQASITGMQALAFLTEKQSQLLASMLGNLALAEAMLASAAAAAQAALDALDALPALIKPGEFKGGSGGAGSSRKADLEALRDLLDQMSFDRLLSGMTELEAGLARLAREYDQNLEKAHGNAELVAQLTEEYRLQAEQLLRNIQLSAVDVFQDFMGIGASPFAQLTEGWENARKAVEEAGFGADRASQMLARLNRHYAEQVKILSRQQFVSIGDGLLGILERYYGGVEGFEKFRMKLERTRFELELVNLRLQFEILKKNGTLGERMLKRMGKVFAFIDANPIDWGKFVAPEVPGAGGGGGGGAAVDAARKLADALNRLKEIQARSLSSFSQAIRGVVDEFAELRQVLGWTTKLQALYAQELRRVIAEQVSAITRMRDELAFRPGSPETSKAQFDKAQQAANAAVAALAAGDFTALDRIPDLVNRVLELNPRAQASEGSRFLFAWADQVLAQTQAAAEEFALGIDPGGANDPFAWLRTIPTAGDDAVVAAVDRVAFRQDVQTAEERAEAAREAERERKRIERAAAKEERERAKAEARIEKIIQKQVNQIEVLKDIRYELKQGGKLEKAS